MSKMGRPRKEIKQKQFEELCAIQCTQEEICAVLDVCHDTLDKWCHETYDMTFSQVFEQKRQGGKASLRRNQWNLSRTNPTMAIWLGKQYLSQKDHVQSEENKETIAKIDEMIQSIKEEAIKRESIE